MILCSSKCHSISDFFSSFRARERVCVCVYVCAHVREKLYQRNLPRRVKIEWCETRKEEIKSSPRSMTENITVIRYRLP